MSRPNRSVPSGKAQSSPGANFRLGMSMSVGSWGASKGAKRAQMTTTNMMMMGIQGSWALRTFPAASNRVLMLNKPVAAPS